MMGSAVNNTPELSTNKEEGSDRSNDEEIEDIDWTPDLEVLLLYSLHGLKPVGPHKHFRMLAIQERFSNAMNKHISTSVIWKKLNNWYDMEALDEAEAEADAASSVEVEFELPLSEFGEIIDQKMKGIPISIHKQTLEQEQEEMLDIQKEIHIESDTSSQDNKVVLSDGESSKESDSSKGLVSFKSAKDPPKRGSKRTLTPVKDNTPQKKDSFKEVGKKDSIQKEELKKVHTKDEDKKEAAKKLVMDIKKEEKKDEGSKASKKDTSKKLPEQMKKDVEAKKIEQKKPNDTPKNQRETPKQLRTDTPKRGETKTARSETPKQKLDLKKDTNSDKKKEVEKKVESKSPEKTPESTRGGKLRARKDVDVEKSETPTTGAKRGKDLISKASEQQSDEAGGKKIKISAAKGRPTRSSMEPQKPASPAPSPQKRRTRLQ